MAQEAGGLPYGTTNPTGIGAVYFDKVEDPLQTHLKNLTVLQEGQRRREAQIAEQRKITADLIKDINPDVKGIFDTDTPYFQTRTKGLYDKYKQALAMNADPNNPAFAEAYGNMQYDKKALEEDVQASKAQKEMFTKLISQLASDKDHKQFDWDKSNANISRFRLMPYEERKKVNMEDLLVPNKDYVGTLEWVGKNAKNLLPRTTIAEPYAMPDGTKGVRYVTKWTDKPQTIGPDGKMTEGGDIQKFAATLSNDPVRVEIATKEMQSLPQGQYEAIKQQADMRGVPAHQVFLEQTLRGLNTQTDKLQEGKFNPYTMEAAKAWGAGKKGEESAKYIADQLDALYRGDVNVYGPEQGNLAISAKGTYDFPGLPPNLKVAVEPVKYSDWLTGIPAGYFDTKDPVTKKYTTTQNMIYGWKMKDGKLYVKTTQSSDPSYNPTYNKPDEEGYVQANDGLISSIARANNIPFEKLRNGLLALNKYGSGTNIPTFEKAKERITW